MAVRQIRVIGDEILNKKCKPVKEMTDRTKELIEDMFETMYEANGVGLAAPQVGVLKRIVVIDVEDGYQYVLINPEIIEQDGEQTGYEGCLSVPGKTGVVTRPNHVVVRALDENMDEIEVEGEGLLARAICHECAHLDGQLYTELVEGELMDTENDEEEITEEIQKMADAYKMEADKIREAIGESGLEQMKKDMAVQKAVTVIADAAVEVEKAADAE